MVLMKGHRVSPVMSANCLTVAWLARVARTPGTLQICVQAVWEATQGNPMPIGLVGNARRVLIRIGWTLLEGWWTWSVPGEEQPLRLAEDQESRVMPVARETVRHQQL